MFKTWKYYHKKQTSSKSELNKLTGCKKICILALKKIYLTESQDHSIRLFFLKNEKKLSFKW